MEGGALFNPGFLGDDFIWWIGQIADDSTWRDNMMTGKFPSKDTVPGWGARYKVRIMGVHDQGETAIPSADLPWANIMYPVTAGGGQAASYQTANLRQGNIVFGFFLDGQDMQVPVIMGVMGNNTQTELGMKIGKNDNSVTNTQEGTIAKSGYAKGEEEKKGTTKPKVPDAGLVTDKPVKPEIAKESAPSAPGAVFDKFGLDTSRLRNVSQLQDIASAKLDAQTAGLVGGELDSFVKKKVLSGMKNRAGAAKSPASASEPGVTQEHPDNPHQLAAGDVKREDKYHEKIPLMKPDDAVKSATKAIQTEIDNLTGKVDKFLGSRKSFIDAVSGPPSQDEITRELRSTATKVSKYQKVIMDKVAEYQNKKMNDELKTVVAALPSSMRYMFADQKFLNTQNIVKEFNNITNNLTDQMEGILSAKLDIASLIKKADAVAASGALWADSNSQSAVSGVIDLDQSSDGGDSGDSDVISVENINDIRTPKVPLCYAEDVVAQGIAANRDQMSKIASNQHNNYNRFLDDVKSQLQKEDQALAEAAYNKTDLGKVLEISDEEEDDLPIGGTLYYTDNGVPCSGGTGIDFKVDIVVPSGGWYDNGFATINDEGAGYTVNTADSGGPSGTGSTTGATVTGGSGSGLKLNYTISGGKITGISTNTVGANYKDGDVLTIVNNAAATPSTNATFTIDKVRGAVDSIENGGIKIADPGNGYTVGDLLTVVQQGSGGNCGISVLMIMDPGDKKATPGPVTPGDTQGSVADSKPNVGQKFGDMLQMLGGMSGNMTQALDFVNLSSNIFPFEAKANQAVSDFYTLARGGAGQPEIELPSSSAIDKAISKVKDIAPAIPGVPFAIPEIGKPPIDLISKQLGGAAGFGGNLGINRGSTQEQLNSAISQAKSKMDVDWDDAMNASREQLDDALDMF